MLNRRLRAIASLIDPCNVLVDIGSDHGYLPLQLIKDGRIKSAVLSELREKPLGQARKHFIEEGLSDHAKFVLSDGIHAIKESVEHVVIAGMGFETIIQIIDQDLSRFKQCDQIILQSNTKVELVRDYMLSKQFELIDEVFVVDRKHPYIILKYRHSDTPQQLSKSELLYGPILTKSLSQEYRNYLMSEHLKYKRLLHLGKADIVNREAILSELLNHS